MFYFFPNSVFKIIGPYIHVCECVNLNSRHGPVAVDLNGLQQSRGRHLLTQVMMRVCSESVVAVDQRHKGQRLTQRMKLQLLWRDTDRHSRHRLM